MIRFIGLFCLFYLLNCSIAYSQTATWSNVADKQTKLASKSPSLQKKIKQYKLHLQQWGLDENFNHAFAIGGKINSDGWSGLLFYELKVSKTRLHFYQFSFSEVKHEKQIKQVRKNAFPDLGISTPFVFGKINNLYTLNVGIGREQMLLPGVLEGNIMVSLRTQAGFSLAMLKPYLLNLVYVDHITGAESIRQESYSSQNAEKFLNASYVLGSAGFTKGLGNIKPVPGGYADAAIAIEPVKHTTFVKTVTLGASIALYAKKLPIMADQKAYPFIAQLYAGLYIGKRWK